jgi:DNA primase
MADADTRVAAGQLLKAAAEHYMDAMRTSPHAVEYLRRRGIRGATAARYGIGYSRPSWNDLAPLLSAYDGLAIEATGLLVAVAGSRRRSVDRFRGRIMFPITDAVGQLVGFGGRVLDHSEPKYLNSPEGPLFRKRELLYGLHEARDAIVRAGYAIVVEGFVDVIALAQAGIDNAVGTLGTACSPSQIELLLGQVNSVCFCFDGDAAGRAAAAKVLPVILPFAGSGRVFRFAWLPSGHDPDSLLRASGPEAMQAALNSAQDLTAYLLVHVTDGCDIRHIEGRARAAARAGELWRGFPLGTEAEAFLLECASALDLRPDALRASWLRTG